RGEVKQLLKKLCALGPKTVIITDGSKGAYASDCKIHYKMGVFPIKIVEMTGAGDAFATGIIAALHYGKTIDEALRWGTANSTSVISSIGPQEGLLGQDGIQKILRKYSKIKPRRI
ncbi:carbohydrate kinase family protein, partial [Patescibacteria group bacterium]